MNIVKEKILKEITPISDQLQLLTCVPNTLCDGMEYVNGNGVNLSRMFVFWNSLKGSSGGALIDSSFDVAKNIGVPPENLWPYLKENVDVKPTDEAFKRAGDTKGNFSLVLSRKEIIAAIDSNNPVIIGIVCPQSFNNPKSLIKDRPFKSDDPVDETYLHAMLIVGYKIFDNGTCHFRIRNSYGVEWMDGGYCWFESDYIINNTSSSWQIHSVYPNESIVSKRNSEIIFGISILFILMIFGIIKAPIVWAIITPIVTAFFLWRRIYANKSVRDEANIFKLISLYRNSTGSPVKLFRGIINYFLR